ncbi:MAG: hypothetical protein H6710_23740 [Myxococcales bacterium]|nr:hypothetical protein [Myxococcales bacterium]
MMRDPCARPLLAAPTALLAALALLACGDDGEAMTTGETATSTATATATASTTADTDATASGSTTNATSSSGSASATGDTTTATTGETSGTGGATTDTDTSTSDTTATTDTTTDGTTTGGGVCDDVPRMPAGDEVIIAPEFAEFYTTYELGPVPGIPPEARLGGTTVHFMDDNTLLIAGYSEASNGKIYSIGVTRGKCDHIVGFDGQATIVAETPYVDANLVYVKSGLLFYTEWPVNRISQLLPGDMAPAYTTDLAGLGIAPSPGGLGFVPPSLADPGGMRALSWAGGEWYHIDRTPNGELFTLSNPVKTATLPNGPGGFAYVPKDSPGFDTDAVIVAEWSANKVGVYEVNDQGDPLVNTRKDFYTKFPLPWGAYFEPLTGDYLFLTWGVGVDKVYIVQGFKPPPPLPQ